MKKVAIVGGNREGLALLSMFKKTTDAAVVMIADPNPASLIFKLGELGYKLSDSLGIEVTSPLDALGEKSDIDIIIDASGDEAVHSYLHSLHMDHAEIISPLSARLIWERAGGKETAGAALASSEKAGLLSSLKEIIDAVNLTTDKSELLSMVLRVALTSTGSERGSIMLLDRKGDTLKIEVSQGIDDKISKSFSCRSAEGIAGKVLHSGKPLLLSGVVSDSKLDSLRSLGQVKAAISVPLMSGKQAIGVLNVSTEKSKDAFSKKDLEFLTALAAIGARIILRSQEIEDLRHDSGALSIWKNISGIMTSSSPLGKKLRMASKIISSCTGGECSIYTAEAASSELCLRASSGDGFSPSTYLRLARGEGVEGVAAATKTEIMLTGKLPDKEVITLKAYPLIWEGEVQGVMRITCFRDGEKDGKDVLSGEIISLIAEEIKNSFREEEMSLKTTKLSAINEAGIKLISLTDMKELTRMIASSAALILEADEAVVRIKDRTSGHLTIRAAYGMSGRESKLSLFRLDKEIALATVMSGKTTLVPDLRKSTYATANLIVRSAISQPLMRGKEVIGILSLYDKTLKGSFPPVAFSGEDKEILCRFASYAEKAVLNLLEEEKSISLTDYDDLTGLLNGESLERRLREELERAKRYRKTFTFALIEVPNLNSYVSIYGHEGGDRMVKDIAHMLRKGVRAFDIIGRFWGSRFGIILPESDEKGTGVVKRLIDKIENKNLDYEGFLAPERVRITCGAVEYSKDFIDTGSVIKKAAGQLDRARKEPLTRKAIPPPLR